MDMYLQNCNHRERNDYAIQNYIVVDQMRVV